MSGCNTSKARAEDGDACAKREHCMRDLVGKGQNGDAHPQSAAQPQRPRREDAPAHRQRRGQTLLQPAHCDSGAGIHPLQQGVVPLQPEGAGQGRHAVAPLLPGAQHREAQGTHEVEKRGHPGKRLYGSHGALHRAHGMRYNHVGGENAETG